VITGAVVPRPLQSRGAGAAPRPACAPVTGFPDNGGASGAGFRLRAFPAGAPGRALGIAGSVNRDLPLDRQPGMPAAGKCLPPGMPAAGQTAARNACSRRLPRRLRQTNLAECPVAMAMPAACDVRDILPLACRCRSRLPARPASRCLHQHSARQSPVRQPSRRPPASAGGRALPVACLPLDLSAAQS
jgi:hypothetical protein